ncbi:hypothetical protein OIV83_005902 [Microbotryomycetes sp. JL201]|nr:hypothetical protein OIV83_005902 [Microbotryomycetes sp. JL201]
MASYYSRRSYLTASWVQPRLYPRQEPTFEHDSAPQSASTGNELDRAIEAVPDAADAHANTGEAPAYDDDGQPPTRDPPRQPPPLYFPGEAQLARLRTRMGTEMSPPPGMAPSTNVLHSATACIQYISHPTIKPGWKRFVRADMWYDAIVNRRPEVLSDAWPREFGGARVANQLDRQLTNPTPLDDIEAHAADAVSARPSHDAPTTAVSRMTSRRSGVSAVDSGVALTPRGTMDVQHPLEPLFRQRIDELNELIPQQLVTTRVYLALLEIANIAWLVALVVALALDGGKQTGFLKGVEIALVLVILLNGIGVNAMRRWALARALRNRTRDWSPLPITTSTNLALLDNAGLNAGHHFLGQTDPTTLAERVRNKDVATLRWRMRATEGSWWLSYRPVIKCELVSPGSSGIIAYGEPTPLPSGLSPQEMARPNHDNQVDLGRAPAYEA